jgi:hypothetical protein
MYSELGDEASCRVQTEVYTLGSFWYSYRFMLSVAVNSLLLNVVFLLAKYS